MLYLNNSNCFKNLKQLFFKSLVCLKRKKAQSNCSHFYFYDLSHFYLLFPLQSVLRSCWRFTAAVKKKKNNHPETIVNPSQMPSVSGALVYGVLRYLCNQSSCSVVVFFFASLRKKKSCVLYCGVFYSPEFKCSPLTLSSQRHPEQNTDSQLGRTKIRRSQRSNRRL